MDDIDRRWYWGGYFLTWVVIFIGGWVYCIAEYGFLLGVGLGWLPAGITATIAAFFWPVIVIGLVWLYLKYG